MNGYRSKTEKNKCRNKGSWLSRDKDAEWRHRRLAWAGKRRSVCSKRIKTSAVIRVLDGAEIRMRSDVIVGCRRQTNVDQCARMWPSKNLLLLHFDLVYVSSVKVSFFQGQCSMVQAVLQKARNARIWNSSKSCTALVEVVEVFGFGFPTPGSRF